MGTPLAARWQHGRATSNNEGPRSPRKRIRHEGWIRDRRDRFTRGREIRSAALPPASCESDYQFQMKHDDHRHLLAHNPACTVELCGCGTVHLTIGPITLRLQPSALDDLGHAIDDARRRLPDLHTLDALAGLARLPS